MATAVKPSNPSEMEPSKVKGNKTKLSLKGSAKLVAEFFQYSIHNILYLRGVYPADDFTAVKKYGLTMLVSSDDQVKAYIKNIMSALDRWMKTGHIQKLAIILTNKDTGEAVERWTFDVTITAPQKSSKSKPSSHKPPTSSSAANQENSNSPTTTPAPPPPTEAEIQSAIAAIFKQISASLAFLPPESGAHTFNVVVHADAQAEVPLEWGDSVDGGREITGGEKVQLRGFSTGMHEIATVVEYKVDA